MLELYTTSMNFRHRFSGAVVENRFAVVWKGEPNRTPMKHKVECSQGEVSDR